MDYNFFSKNEKKLLIIIFSFGLLEFLFGTNAIMIFIIINNLLTLTLIFYYLKYSVRGGGLF